VEATKEPDPLSKTDPVSHGRAALHADGAIPTQQDQRTEEILKIPLVKQANTTESPLVSKKTFVHRLGTARLAARWNIQETNSSVQILVGIYHRLRITLKTTMDGLCGATRGSVTDRLNRWPQVPRCSTSRNLIHGTGRHDGRRSSRN
jgi:hypothetical protein